MFALPIWADRRFDLHGGRLFALYVAAYTVGRAWVEALRVDHANHIVGLRLNPWTPDDHLRRSRGLPEPGRPPRPISAFTRP